MLYTCQNPITEILLLGKVSLQPGRVSVDARSFSALAFRLNGSGQLQCGEKSYWLNAGDVLYMPQGVRYFRDYEKTDILLFHFITAKNDTEPEIYHLKNPDEISRQFQKAYGIWEAKQSGYIAKCFSILYKILGLLGENEAQTGLPQHFIRAVSILNESFCSSQLRISQVCKAAAISETVFRQLFRQHYGKSPVEYVTELRLEYAHALITEGMTIEQAALESGFSDGKYFARIVKRHLGCTPRQLKTYG